MRLVVQVKLLPTPEQAAALEATLHACNDAANLASQAAFTTGARREYALRKHTYGELKARGLGAQAAQHVIKKVADAYTTLRANVRAGNLGRHGSARRARATSKPIAFRADAAQPFDDRCLSWRIDARTVSICHDSGQVAQCGVHRVRRTAHHARLVPERRIRPGLPGRHVVPDRHLRGP
ncbi:hypothetical protein FHR32_007430 [Streptosporangium album]|uniref:Transposase n=1 Tax=Streptosporangium album TaxID=47479 RepID=A0A7W7S341_9ACTN|nr:hypothetical protein [Streptosporangium album]